MFFLNRYFLISFEKLISIVTKISQHFNLGITGKSCSPWIMILITLINLSNRSLLIFEIQINW